MRIVPDSKAMQRLTRRWFRRGETVGFVPTMGALHRGHYSLMERARRENDKVVVSVFVNPLQFGPREDFRRYPRPFRADAALCRKAGADALYHPSPASVYPEGFATLVHAGGVSELLEGRARPGHFDGVATVVLKLFEAVRPDRAYFGEKDWQQLVVVRRMAADLDLAVRVVGCPTVRESDGLALSSRNTYLSARERRQAGLISKGLKDAAALAAHGERDCRRLRAAMLKAIAGIAGARVDYVEVADPATLLPLKRLERQGRILAAVRVGKTRLIDNRALRGG